MPSIIWPDSLQMALKGGLHVLDYRGLRIGCVSTFNGNYSMEDMTDMTMERCSRCLQQVHCTTLKTPSRIRFHQKEVHISVVLTPASYS